MVTLLMMMSLWLYGELAHDLSAGCLSAVCAHYLKVSTLMTGSSFLTATLRVWLVVRSTKQNLEMN